MDESLGLVLLSAVAVLIIGTLLIAGLYRKVPPGQVLLVSDPRGMRVVERGTLVIPGLARAERLDLRPLPVTISHRGAAGVTCRDGKRADMDVSFLVEIEADQVVAVVQTFGRERATDLGHGQAIFAARFSQALKAVAARCAFDELRQSPEALKPRLRQMIGTDLDGYLLAEIRIEHLAQTPLEQLDAANPLDALAIKHSPELAGLTATLTQRADPQALSQATLLIGGHPFFLNVASEDANSLPRGTQVRLGAYDAAQDRFPVRAFRA